MFILSNTDFLVKTAMNKEIKSICKEDVFSNFYTHNAEQLRNYIYYKCGRIDTAEDIVQQTFIKVWEKCKEVIYEKAKAFLYKVAGNLFLDHVKSKKVALEFIKKETIEVDKNDPESVLITNEFRQKLEKVISELPDGQREVFLMNRIDKLTYKEIAHRLDVSETAVEKRMSKALFKLRSRIEEIKHYKI